MVARKTEEEAKAVEGQAKNEEVVEETQQNPHPLAEFYTYAGVPLQDAFAALDSALPKEAYKDVTQGSFKYTDISPTYLLERITQLFGPFGIGWGCNPVQDNITEREEIEVRENKWAKGDQPKTKEVRTIHVMGYYDHWYRYGTYLSRVGGAEITFSKVGEVKWTAPGGNKNPNGNIEWTHKGAMTNAIGTGWFLQGAQWRIYKGQDFSAAEMKEAGEGNVVESAKKSEDRSKERDEQVKLFREVGELLKSIGANTDAEKKELLREAGITSVKDMGVEETKKYIKFLEGVYESKIRAEAENPNQ